MDSRERQKEWIKTKEKIFKDEMVYRSAYQDWLQYYNFRIKYKRMNKILNLGGGYRTYLAAVLMVAWAAYGWWAGTVEVATAQLILVEALAIFGLRRAIK